VVQRGGDWAGCGPAQFPPRCTKCNSPPINGQRTNLILFDVTLLPLHCKGFRYLTLLLFFGCDHVQRVMKCLALKYSTFLPVLGAVLDDCVSNNNKL